MRIRSRLLILVLAVLIPAIIAAAAGIAYVYLEAQQANKQNMREVVRALALVVDKEIARREAILHTLGASQSLDDGNLGEFYRQAQRISGTTDSAIVLRDKSGAVLFNTRLPFDARLPPAVPAVQELRERYGPDATIVSNLYFSPISKINSFSIQVPVARGGKAIYYLDMGMSVHILQSVFDEQRLPSNWIGTIVDRTGVVVARSRQAENFVGQQGNGPIIAKIMQSSEGFNDGTALSGEAVSAFFSKAPSSDWTFVVSVPQKDMRQAGIDATMMLALLSLFLFGCAIWAALWVAAGTSKSTQVLRRAAESLGRGDDIAAHSFDIEEMDAVHAAMQKTSAELRSAKQELERRVDDAVADAKHAQRALLQGQKLESLGRLTGGIAHDFNNVLQTLTTGLQVAALTSKEEKVKTLIATCQRAVKQGTQLASQLMAFGRTQEARLETVDIAHQVHSAMPLLNGALPSNIEFKLDLAPGIWPVSLDPLQFELALLNLVMNSRDAMPQGGSIQLSVRNESLAQAADPLEAGDYVCLTLGDSGAGMSDEVSSKALDPFFTTKIMGKGSGMGLPQAYGFARQSGGTLTLSSKPDEGTRVAIYLPRTAGSMPAAKPARKESSPSMPAATLLLVEDDTLIRDTVRPALELAGLDVTVARDGDEALRILDSGSSFDLILSDIVMPGATNGIALARAITERFSGTHIVLATGYTEHTVGIPGVRILAKPYDLGDLVNVLKHELQRPVKKS
ncbi:MAG: ATP-binding protein [Pseudomonadota bacterium]